MRSSVYFAHPLRSGRHIDLGSWCTDRGEALEMGWCGATGELWLRDRRNDELHVAAVVVDRREAESLLARCRALAERTDQLGPVIEEVRRLQPLAAQIEPRVDAQLEQRWTVPAEPVRAIAQGLVEFTGDDVRVVARGLGLDGEVLRDVLDGSRTELGIPEVQQICEALHCTPYDLWGTETGRSILHAYGPELWPRFIEPLVPPDVSLGTDSAHLGDRNDRDRLRRDAPKLDPGDGLWWGDC